MSLSERLQQGNSTDAKAFPNIGNLGEKFESVSYEEEDNLLLKNQVLEKLIQSLGQQLYSGQIDDLVLEQHVYEAIADVFASSQRSLNSYDRAKLVQQIIDEILGLGPLQSLLRDSEVTEVMVKKFDQIFVERNGHIYLVDLKFSTEEHLRRTIERIVSQVGRRIDESSPMVDARLQDGSRVNAVVPPIAIDGSTLTIRKFSQDPFTSKDLIATGTVSIDAMNFLSSCVKAKYNIVISGGTGSGKTTTLNVLSAFIGKDERIITIEDAAELQLPQKHVIRLESRPLNTEGKGIITIRDLVRNALRMRPDRIVVGEVRDAAALDMLQAMNTGHEGSLTTVHANTTRDALMRIETMSLMAGMDLPVEIIREQLVGAIDIVVQQSRMRDGSRRITQISEIVGLEGNTIQMQDIFAFVHNTDPKSMHPGELVHTGLMMNQQSHRTPLQFQVGVHQENV